MHDASVPKCLGNCREVIGDMDVQRRVLLLSWKCEKESTL